MATTYEVGDVFALSTPLEVMGRVLCYSCLLCGAVVCDLDQHVLWHNGGDNAAK